MSVIVCSNLRAANVEREKLWENPDKPMSLSYLGNATAGEMGEACNVIKKLDREAMGMKGSRDTVEHLAEELADVMIYIDIIALRLGIDMDEAIANKFNKTSTENSFGVFIDSKLFRQREDSARSHAPENFTDHPKVG
jgi:NTP pyrophosphatase (non-canonical NTP hydrolase)